MSSRGVNKVILIGNLGADPEIRYTQDSTCVAVLSVGTNESWTDKQNQQQTRVEWHRCVAYRGLAEVCQQYLTKGGKVYIEGRLKTRKWKAQDGSDRFTTEVVIQDMQMLGGNRNQNIAPPPPAAEPNRNSSSGTGSPMPPPDFDDDIPF